MDAAQKQVRDTLRNLRDEVSRQGVTEAACEMWSHALSMYRRSKADEGVDIDDSSLPAFLKRQAE